MLLGGGETESETDTETDKKNTWGCSWEEEEDVRVRYMAAHPWSPSHAWRSEVRRPVTSSLRSGGVGPSRPPLTTLPLVLHDVGPTIRGAWNVSRTYTSTTGTPHTQCKTDIL